MSEAATMAGVTVGSYKLLDKIGEGGMGVVYRAEHTTLGKLAALKMLLPEYSKKESIVTRFFNEARATARIKHPGLIEIYDYGHHTDGSAFIVMELLQGQSLAAKLKSAGALDVPILIEYTRQIANALQAAHAANIVHRDLKPDNVFLVPSEDLQCGVRCKVLDFGIAKLIDDGHISQVKTRTGVLMGTPIYMSPEQCRGASRVDHRSDIYSLGVMMFEMAMGKPPFVSEGLGEVIAMHMYEPTPPCGIAPQLDPVFARALAKKVEDRYQSMTAFLADLDTLLLRGTVPRASIDVNASTEAGERPVTIPPPPARRAAVWVIAAGLAVVAAGVGLVAWRANHTTPPGAGETTQPASPGPQVKAPEPTPHAELPTPNLPAIPARIALAIESSPPGASVFRAADGVRVGKTPYKQELERGSGEALFYVKLAGYRDVSVALPIDQSGVRRVLLERLGRGKPVHVATPAPPVKAPEPTPPPPARPDSHSIQTGELHSM